MPRAASARASRGVQAPAATGKIFSIVFYHTPRRGMGGRRGPKPHSLVCSHKRTRTSFLVRALPPPSPILGFVLNIYIYIFLYILFFYKRSCDGILSKNCTENPDFCNYNHVFIGYCDGSSFSGRRDGAHDGLMYRGRPNLDAVLDSLISKGLGNAKNVVFTGGSAGGLTTYLQVRPETLVVLMVMILVVVPLLLLLLLLLRDAR